MANAIFMPVPGYSYGSGDSSESGDSGNYGDKKLLWTNSSPTTVFKAQTLELDLSEYDGVLVQSNYRSDQNNGLPLDGSYSFVRKGETGRIIGAINTTNTTMGVSSRCITVADDGVTFTTGIVAAGGTAEAACVPCSIWGVSFGGYKSGPYLRHNEDSGNIQVMDEDGNWQDYAACPVLPVPTADVLYLNGKEYITWTEDSIYSNTYTLTDNVTKYEDRMVMTGLGSNTAKSGGIAGQYTFDNKFNYLHVMNSAGTVVTLDCSAITGTYYILFNNSGWDNCFRFSVSPYKYDWNQNSTTNVCKKLIDAGSLVVNNTVTITKIWMDNKAS